MLNLYFINYLIDVSSRSIWFCLSVGWVFCFCACNWNVGSVDIQLVYTSDVQLNPLSKNLVKTLRINIEGQGMSTVASEYDLALSDGVIIPDIPVGKQRIVTIEGYNSAGDLVSRGRSLPFRTDAGNQRIYLYFSLVDRFSSPPSGLSEPDWVGRYKVRMSTTRVFHDAVALPDGLVLVTGGILAPNADNILARVFDEELSDPALRSMERFDATSGAFLLEQDQADCNEGKLCMRARRAFHCAQVFPGDALVLLIGGEPIDELWPAEYYHIGSNSFETKEDSALRTRHACVSVNGSYQGILVAGGMGATPTMLLDDVELIGNDEEVQLPQLSLARAQARAVSVPGGVMIIGGWEQWDPRRASARVDYIRFEGDGSISSSWFEMQKRRVWHTAVVLEDENDAAQVLVCGGLSHEIDDSLVVDGSCEILDPETNTSRMFEGFTQPLWGHSASVLGDGRVLLAGGFITYAQTMIANNYSILLDNPLKNSYKQVIPMISKRAFHTVTALQNGLMVFIGGISTVTPSMAEMASQDYEIFNPKPE